MFENWAADLLANYLGKFVDVQRDRLKISLWGGEGILENVQLRVDAFDYLQLPFVVKEGCIGGLKLQIPWGRWRGGALVVELSDVVLCISSRAESDWEEGPALRRAQAAKQAQLAAAELAKLGSRVAATGQASHSIQQADYAAATAAGAAAGAAGATTAGTGLGNSWGWAIVDYITSFLLNRLHFEVKNVHAFFEAPANSASEYEAFGVQLGSLTTVVPGKVPDLLASFAGLKAAEPGLAAKVVRQLHVQGWSCYWKPRREQQQLRQHIAGASSTAGQPLRQAATAAQRRGPPASAAPVLDATDYILAPVEAVLELAVHSSGIAAGGSVGSSASSGVACDVFIGAPDVSMQLSSQQLAGMGRLADDAAVWAKRNTYGRYRPPGWMTIMQARRQRRGSTGFWSSCRSGASAAADSWQPLQPEVQQQQQQHVRAEASQQGSGQQSSCRGISTATYKQYTLTPTGRCGIGAPVTWLQVWHYAVRATIADLRDNSRKLRGRTLRKKEVMARRHYVHLYQQKLDSLQHSSSSTSSGPLSTGSAAQPAAPATAVATSAAASAPAATSSSSRSSSQAGESSVATAVVSDAPRSAVSKAECEAPIVKAADVAAELTKLETELDVEDILLCRSLAELALDRRTADSSEAERYRSWFAWGASSLANYIYPNSTASTAASSSKHLSTKAGRGSSGGGGSDTSMPTEADLDELLALLHGGDADAVATGVSAAASSAAAVAGGEAGAAAATAGTSAAIGDSSTLESSRCATSSAPAVSLNWHLLSLRAVLQDCPQPKQRKELLVLNIEGTSIQATSRDRSLSAQLLVQDFQLYDCCSDPGVRECVLQRLDPESALAVASGVQVVGRRNVWGKGIADSGSHQGSEAQQHNAGAHGWADRYIPTVTSQRAMAATAPRSTSTGSKHRALQPPLLSVSVDAKGLHKHITVHLEQLQLLARPGCILGLQSMLQLLPEDTLDQKQQAAAADIQAEQETVGLQLASNSTVQKCVQLPAQMRHLQANLLLQEVLVLVPTSLDYASSLNAVIHLQAMRLSPAAAAAEQDTGLPADNVIVQQNQAELQSDALSEDNASSTDSDTASSDVSSDVDDEFSIEASSSTPSVSSSSSSSSSSRGSGGSRLDGATPATAADAAAIQASASRPLLQQYTLELAMLTVGVQQPASHKLEGSHQQQQQQQQMQELLKLSAVQGSLVLSYAAASSALPNPGVATFAAADADGPKVASAGPASQHPQQQLEPQQPPHKLQQRPLVKLALQLPPLRSTVTATVMHALQLFSQVLQSQLQLPLAEFAECYKLGVSQQLAALAQKQLQQQHQPQSGTASSADETSALTSAAERATAAAAGETDVAAAEPPSPTDSEVEKWMVAPGSLYQAVPAPAAAAERSHESSNTDASGLPLQPRQSLKRCDSDDLLHPMSPPGMDMLAQPPEQQQQQQPQTGLAVQQQQQQQGHQQQGPRMTAAAAAAALTVPAVQLFELEVLLAELDVQYIEDVSADDTQGQLPQQQHAQPDSPNMHLRLQTSLLRVLFRHSTHDSKADVCLSGLVLQDMLPADAAGPSSRPAALTGQYAAPAADICPPDIRRLLKHVSLEQVQVTWQQQLAKSGAVQETVVSVTGLQAQGHPGDVGLFLLPAHQTAPTCLAVTIKSTTPHKQPASATAIAAATQVSVQLDNAALGLDGVLKIAAAVQAAASPTSGEAQVDQGQAQPAAQSKAEKHSIEVKPTLALQVQVSQCQVLSCRGSSASSMPAGSMDSDWRPWDLPLHGLQQRRTSARGIVAATSGAPSHVQQQEQPETQQQVVCDLLLDLPLVAVDTAPATAATAPAKRPARSALMVLVEDIGLYIPEACGSDTLLPMLSIPYVSFRQQERQQEGQERSSAASGCSPGSGHAAVLLAQTLHVPAVGASLRPSQVQHIVQLVQRQQQQWQQWNSATPKPPQAPQPPPQQQPQQQNVDSSFVAAIDDLQLLLLAAAGTSDKALLLQWQQLQLKLQHSHHKASQQQQPADTHSNSTTSPSIANLDGKVSWRELSVSAVQQDGQELTSQSGLCPAAGPPMTTAQQPERPVAPADPGVQEVEQTVLPELKLQASLLPAVSWLAGGGDSSEQLLQQQRQQQDAQRRQDGPGRAMASSPFAPAAAAAAAEAQAAASPSDAVPINSRSGHMLHSHAMLSRFLSAKESWRCVDLGSSAASASEAFFSPRSSGSWLSAASSIGNSSGSSTAWASAIGSGHLSASVSDNASQTAQPPRSTATAAAQAPLGPQDSIIAASWHMDIPGSSPGAAAALWGTSPGARDPGVSGLFRPDVQAATAAVAGVDTVDGPAGGAQAGTSPSQPASSSPSRPALGRISPGQSLGSSSRHISSFSHRRGAVQRSFIATHSQPLRSRSSQQMGIGCGDSIAEQDMDGPGALAQQSEASQQWFGVDDEFFSVAGDSAAADDHSESDSDSEGHSPAAQGPSYSGGAACQLLPMPGFSVHGCDASARWLLLSLMAGMSDSAGSTDANSPSGTSESAGAGPAVHLMVTDEMPQPDSLQSAQSVARAPSMAAANIVNSTLHSAPHQQQQQQICKIRKVDLLLLGWQLQLNAKCWDMVAPGILQTVNAATAAAPAGTAVAASHQHVVMVRPPSDSMMPDSQATSGRAATGDMGTSLLVQVNVKQLQIMLFVPPNDAPAVGAAASGDRQHHPEFAAKHVLSKDFGPWQDPDSTASPTAAAPQGGGKDSPLSTPFCSPVKDPLSTDPTTPHLSAQVVVLKLDASAVLTQQDSASASQQQKLSLQEASVPELAVGVGATAWDAATVRPLAGVWDQQHQQFLLLVLLKQLCVRTAPGFLSMTQQQQQPQPVYHVPQRAGHGHLEVTRLLDDTISVTPAAAICNLATATNHSPTVAALQAYDLELSSISGWVSTVRLSLLMQLQQVLLQQLPAITAAAALAGPSSQTQPRADTVAQQGPPPTGGSSSNHVGSAHAQTGVTARRHNGTAAAAEGLSCKLTAHKVAVLVSSDEPEPWLLQHSTSRPAVDLCSSSSKTAADQRPTFTTCTTPLLEVVILPLTVQVHITDGCRSKQPQLEVDLSASVQADVFSVNKLGWEPVLDPWHLTASLHLAPTSNTTGHTSNQSLKAAVTATNLLDLTVAPSSIVSLQQLQVLCADAAGWHSDTDRLQQLLHCLSNPDAATAFVSGGRSYWLVNQTGTPLDYTTVADATGIPAAAAALALSSKVSGVSPVGTLPSSNRGRAEHQVPVPLRVIDRASAGYYGRYVESPVLAAGTPAAVSNSSAAAQATKRPPVLFVQAPGQASVVGPIALGQLGCSLHSVSLPSPGTGSTVTSWNAGANHPKRPRLQQLVAEVSRHRYGGQLVSLHSTVELVNRSNAQLELGYCSASGHGAADTNVMFGVVGPGSSIWLPLQVLQSSGPSLRLRPAGTATEYAWCKALNVFSLLPASPTAVNMQPSSTSATVDDTGFWYYPSRPKSGSRYLTFQATVQPGLQEQQQGMSPVTTKQPGSTRSSSTMTLTKDPGQVCLAVGCCAKPSFAASGAGSVPGLWQVVVEAPAIFMNQLPVPVDVSVAASVDGAMKGLLATVGSRDSLPIYGCQAQHISHIRLRPSGFQSSEWLALDTRLRTSTGNGLSAAACASDGTGHEQLTAAVDVQVAATRSDQPPQTLQLQISRSSLTGNLTMAVSCSLWLYNCLGFQVAVKQPDDEPALDRNSSSMSSSSSVHSWTAGKAAPVSTVTDAAVAANAGSGPALWLSPYPWLLPAAGSANTLDLAGNGQQSQSPTAAASNSASMAALAIARSTSTPALGTLGIGLLTSPPQPLGSSGGLADLSRSGTAACRLPQPMPFTPVAMGSDPALAALLSPTAYRHCLPGLSNLGSQDSQQLFTNARRSSLSGSQHHPQPDQLWQGAHSMRRSLSSSTLGVQPLQPQQPQQDFQQMGSPTAARLSGMEMLAHAHSHPPRAAAAPDSDTSPHQDAPSAAPMIASPHTMSRQRRHSSGLFMLASGQLPSMLSQDLQGTPTPGSVFQQVCAANAMRAGCGNGPIVYPLRSPDSSRGWLPLLAAGDLAVPSYSAGPAAAAESPSSQKRQRSSAAAAAVDALLADITSQQQQQKRTAPACDESMRTANPCAATATELDTNSAKHSMGSAYHPATFSPAGGLGCVAQAAHGLQSPARTPFAAASAVDPSAGMFGLTMPRPGLAHHVTAVGAASNPTAAKALGSSVTGRPRGAGSMGSSVAAAGSTGPAAAAPVICGWPCQAGPSTKTRKSSREAAAEGQPSSSVQLQLCAAPATAAAVASRGLQQLASCWSPPATVELRQGVAGPANILKVPLASWSAGSARTRSSTGGLETVAAAASLDGASRMHNSISSSTLASLDSPRSGIAPALQQHSPRKPRWRRLGHSHTAEPQQGACFVSVHTAPVPGGGGAWAVHLLPTYLLVNTLQCEVHLRQYGSDTVLQSVPPGGHCCVLWPDASLPLKLQFRQGEPGWSWSGAAAVESPGEFLVKIRHRNRGETLLLQLDVAAASSGSSMVATLSAPEGGFAPYRIENCSSEVIHVQQVGCVEQEDVLQPYSSLPFAWDEPSLPHRVLLFLPGRRLLGEVALEQVGQSRKMAISGNRRRTLLLTTYAEGPMRVLRVLDTSIHLTQPPGATFSITGRSKLRAAAAAASGNASRVHGRSTHGHSSFGSQVSLSQLSRTSSTASLASSTQNLQQPGCQGRSNNRQGALLRPVPDKQNALRRLGSFLGLPLQQQQQLGLPGCDSTAVSIPTPSFDLQIQLSGLGVSLVSDSRELLYMRVRSVSSRVCQDALRTALGLCISSIRVENTLYGCQYPLLLVSPVSRSVFGIVVPQAAAAAASIGPCSSSSSSSSSSSTVDELVTQNLGPDYDEVAAAASKTAAAAEDGQAPATANSSSSTALGSPFQQDRHCTDQSRPAAVVTVDTLPLLPQQRVIMPHHLALGVLATVWRSQPSGVVCIEQLGLHVSPLALSLEGKHIKQLVDFSMGLNAAGAAGSSGTLSTSSSRSLKTQQQLVPRQPPGMPAATVQRSHVKLYMEDVRLSPITLCVSFAPDSWFDASPGAATGVAKSPRSAVAADLSRVGPVLAPRDLSLEVPDQTSGTAGTNSMSAAAIDSNASSPAVAAASSNTQDVAEAEAAAATAASTAGELYGGSGASDSSSSSLAAQQLPIWLQMALALAHAEEGAWLTLAPFESSHSSTNTDLLGQVLGRHYVLAAYRELPKVLASLDIFGDPARLLQALGLGFWHLVTLPAHSARWGPHRSLQRLVRGVRVMAYGISSSIAKGSKRSKAALLPLVPAGLTWQQQQQQQLGGPADRDRAAVSSLKRINDGEFGLTGGSSFMGAPAAAAAAGSSSDSANQGAGGQDLLHVLVAGYSLTFQQMLHSFQAGQPLKGLATAVAQALVLPALLLLEITESTATSFRRLLIEQVAGAVPVRVPRYVASGQLLRPYDRLESLGRALLHHTMGSYVTEGFLGCVELHLGLYAVVTAGHLLVISCSVTPPPPAGTSGSNSSSSAAGASLGRQQPQQQAVHVQYKHPELLLVLSVKDVMMVAVEGSAVRLLCMAGDQPGGLLPPGLPSSSTAATGTATPAETAPTSESGTTLDRVASRPVESAADGIGSAPAAAGPAVGPEETMSEVQYSTSGLRELVSSPDDKQLPQQEQQQAQQHTSVDRIETDAASSNVGTSGGDAGRFASSAGMPTPLRKQMQPEAVGLAGPISVVSSAGVVPAAAAPGAVDLTAAVAAVDAAVAAANSGSAGSRDSGVRLGSSGAEAFVGGKWFVGHVVACDSKQAAAHLQQLLQKACSRLDTLIASSVWQRQLML